MKKNFKKLYSFIVCLAIITASITALPANAIAATTVSFSDKIIFENDVLGETSTYGLNNTSTEQEEPESLSVTLRFEESFSCDCGEITSDEELTFHRAEVKAHYKALNERIVNELALEDYEGLSYSNYGPFIEFYYPTYSDFILNDYDILEDKNPADMNYVYIRNNYPCTPAATVSTSTGSNYTFSNALEDIGLKNKSYTGNGIKIGILDASIPTNYSNFLGITYETFGSSTTYSFHSFQVSSIAGGTSGIASEASLYFAGCSDTSLFFDCIDWFLDKDVYIINFSGGFSYGVYDSYAAFLDYVVNTLKMTVITAAGNQRNNNNTHIFNTSSGANVICVAANGKDKKIYHSSSYSMINTWDSLLLKPTLTAPGDNISGINNINESLSGTSFAAPFVTGIVALLMEEFPSLKYIPEEVIAILTASCTPAHGQSTPVDEDAGFGIVNYTNARNAYSNSNFFVTNRNYYYGELIVSKNITLPANSQTLVVVTLLENSTSATPYSAAPTSLNYSNLLLKVEVPVSSNASIVYTGTTIGNFCYVLITNTSVSFSANAKIYYNDVTLTSFLENGAICFYTRY